MFRLAIMQINSNCHVWYLDDRRVIAAGGDIHTVLQNMEHLKHKFKLIGLEINSSK